MKIALTHAFSWPEVRRGGERLVAELARSLAECGAYVTVFSSGFEPSRDRDAGVRSIRFERVSSDERTAEVDFGARVRRSLLAGHFDVVHSFGRYDGAASLRAARLHPWRLKVHTDIGIPSRSWWEHQGDEAPLVEKVIAGVDVYGCMSEVALAALEADYGRRGVLLPGGVDLALFRPGQRTPHPTLLYSGAIDVPRKGVATLLEALPLIRERVPGTRLVLSGPGDPCELLRQAPSGVRAHVDYLGVGALADLPALYASAWACALPSVHDTFGLVLIEALAAGTPVAAGNSHALPELVEVGRTGLLARPFDPISVAEACAGALQLARDPATAERCRRSVERFDWRSSIAPLHLATYESARRRRSWRTLPGVRSARGGPGTSRASVRGRHRG